MQNGLVPVNATVRFPFLLSFGVRFSETGRGGNIREGFRAETVPRQQPPVEWLGWRVGSSRPQHSSCCCPVGENVKLKVLWQHSVCLWKATAEWERHTSTTNRSWVSIQKDKRTVISTYDKTRNLAAKTSALPRSYNPHLGVEEQDDVEEDRRRANWKCKSISCLSPRYILPW